MLQNILFLWYDYISVIFKIFKLEYTYNFKKNLKKIKIYINIKQKYIKIQIYIKITSAID